MKNTKIRNLFLVLGVLSLIACHTKDTFSENPNYTLKGEVITLTPNSNIKSKLKLEQVKSELFSLHMTTVGTVKAIPNQYAEIAPPFAGRVLKSYVKLGQKVLPGSPIFAISSPDYFNAQKEYFDARQEFHLAQLNLKRQQDLLQHGVGIQRELEEAKTNFETNKSALENASAALRIFNIDPSKAKLGQPLIVTSPIKGEVVTNTIVMGQYLKEDASPIVMVAELSKVWIAGQVKEKDIWFIHKLDEVEIKMAAFPNQTIKGEIYHVNEIIDEDTRSVEVLIECENQNRDLKPGMYVNVQFLNSPEPTLIIPTKAVMQMNDTQFVFVQTGKNQYIKRNVETEDIYNGKVAIKSGLKEGETIVTEGGILLLEAK